MRLFLVLTCVALVAGRPALAETYKWIDEKGRVQYTDRLPPEAVNRSVVGLTKQGRQSSVLEAPLTDAQLNALEEKLEKERQAKRAAVAKLHEENALLSSFSSESDIELAKRRNLALIGSGILSAEARIKALQRRQIVLEREQLFYEKKAMPERMRRELANVIAEIPKQYTLIYQKNEEALQVIKRYDEQKARFRDLKEQMAREAALKKKVRELPPAG